MKKTLAIMFICLQM